MRVFRREPECPFVKAGPSDDDGPGLLQRVHARCVGPGLLAVERGAGGSDSAPLIDQIFESHGNTGEWPDVFALADPGVDFGGPLQRSLVIYRYERVECVLGAIGRIERSLNATDGGSTKHARDASQAYARRWLQAT